MSVFNKDNNDQLTAKDILDHLSSGLHAAKKERAKNLKEGEQLGGFVYNLNKPITQAADASSTPPEAQQQTTAHALNKNEVEALTQAREQLLNAVAKRHSVSNEEQLRIATVLKKAMDEVIKS